MGIIGQKDVDVKISRDGMKCYIILNPPDNDISALKETIVIQRLQEAGVCFGIKSDLISKAIKTRFFGKSFVVAEGIPAINGEDAVIDYKFKEKNTSKLEEYFDSKIDFRESAIKIKVVHNGEILVVKKPATKGIHGTDIAGKRIPAEDGKDISIPTGENTKLSLDKLTLYAVADGYVSFKDGKIDVVTSYEINGDVDMSTGNIYFVGPVKIKGCVKEGFIVKTHGDIEIGGNIENAMISSGGNIIIDGGIIGKRSVVSAKGKLKCKFIEHATVTVKGNIIVEDTILYSNIETDGSVIVLEGRKGAIIGGKIVAGKEIAARNIGSISETPTEVFAGIPPDMREEMQQLIEDIEQERQIFCEIKSSHDNEAKIKEREIQSNIITMTEKLNQIKKYIATHREGKVSAFERICAGVNVSVGLNSLLLKVDEKYCTFVEISGNIKCWSYERPRI